MSLGVIVMDVNDEHDYIRQLIMDRWWGEVECFVYPLRDSSRQHLFSGRLGEVIALETQAAHLAQHLMNERTRAEDQLRWLELDTALRSEGKNYPNVYECCAIRTLKFHESEEF